MSNYLRIPLLMRNYHQWVCWRYENPNRTKFTKVPYTPGTTKHAMVDDPSTWTDFATALQHVSMYDGVGFVFSKDDPFCGIDLDHTTDRERLAVQMRIRDEFNTYSEISPSGLGLHLICMASVAHGRKRGSIEIYSSHRFFTMTGNICDDKPIAERQYLANVLWAEMGGKAKDTNLANDQEQTKTDLEIYELCVRTNKETFIALWNGKWSEAGYPSQSEADFALVDMIGYHSRNSTQIERMFKQSALGWRDKAKRRDYVETMVNASFDNFMPLLDFDQFKLSLLAGWNTQAANTQTAAAPNGVSAAASVPKQDAQGADCDVTTDAIEVEPLAIVKPPGLIGELIDYFYAQAPRPFYEGALCAALSFMAAIVGRAYNTPTGAGINLYTLLLAETAIGKEMMNSGISKLRSALKAPVLGRDAVPSIDEFFGPAEIKSDAALIKRLAEQRSMLSIIGEFGIQLGNMCDDRAPPHLVGLRRALLDMYSKSGKGQLVNAMAYSDQAKNTDAIAMPAFSILAESTPITFYEAINEKLIAQGLVPRFLIIEYKGIRHPNNPHASQYEPPQGMLQQIAQLAASCLGLNQRNEVVTVLFNAQAAQLSVEFDQFCDKIINGSSREVLRQLWNRAHLKTMKLASLIAIGINPHAPIIDVQTWNWARHVVERDVRNLLQKFERGEVGRIDTDEKVQQDAVLHTMAEWMKRQWYEVENYMQTGTNTFERMHIDGIVPYAFLQRRLAGYTTFRKDRIGPTNAIKRTLTALVDGGQIIKMSAQEMIQRYGRRMDGYRFPLREE